jgi:hypothetical protein
MHKPIIQGSVAWQDLYDQGYVVVKKEDYEALTQKWRPIETVPFEEPILASWKNSKGNRVVSMVCRHMISIESKSAFAETFNLKRVVSYWSSDMDGEDQLYIKPTHWMPLPEPPK